MDRIKFHGCYSECTWTLNVRESWSILVSNHKVSRSRLSISICSQHSSPNLQLTMAFTFWNIITCDVIMTMAYMYVSHWKLILECRWFIPFPNIIRKGEVCFLGHSFSQLLPWLINILCWYNNEILIFHQSSVTSYNISEYFLPPTFHHLGGSLCTIKSPIL